MNHKSSPYLFLRRIGQPIDQQILHHDSLLLVHVVKQVSGTTAFVVGELGFERLAIFGVGCLLHSFECVSVVVLVDLEDDVLIVPASEVVELVHAAACDHLHSSVRSLVELGEVIDTADSAILS